MLAKLACLHSAEASLVLECREGAPPVWRHLGARVDVACLSSVQSLRTAASFSLDEDVALSTVPPTGRGWFGPAIVALRGNQVSLVPDWDTCTVQVHDDRIELTSGDQQAGLALRQVVRCEAGGAFVFSTSIENTGASSVALDRLASALLPLPADCAGIVSWRGRHNAELVELVEAMPQHSWQRVARRGISGHGGPPAVVVLGDGGTQHAGLVFAVQLAWSGDSTLSVERDDEGFWTLCAEAGLRPGEVELAPGEQYAAPDVILSISTQGRNGALVQQHAAIRSRVTWPGGVMTPRKVHLNSWETCYFDHNERRIADLAEAAASVGIERFVLDDGWFKGRNNDDAGLGDWTPDRSKYPAGLKPLAQRVNALGMEFGLWVEPEMVNPDSDLYRSHPDWALALPSGDRPTARNQLVLDMRRDDVRDYLFGCLDALLREVPIGYLKWDHNRDLAPAGGWAQVQGAYALLDRLRAAHPHVEIESCAGGGGRSDAGIAAYTHRFWASDNIDAVSRVPIQRGFLAFLPPEMMGAHVGASPAHATGRSQSLAFRAAVAMPGHFGVELDPAALNEPDRTELADWIAFYKSWRDLLHGGRVWLGEGADGLVWQAQGRAEEFLLFLTRCAPALDRRPQPVKLPVLRSVAVCDVQLLRIAGSTGNHAPPTAPLFEAMRAAPQRFSGSWLAEAGLPVPPLKAESVAIFHVKAAQ